MSAKKKFKMPTAFGILFALTIFVAILTWVLPAGHYDYADEEGNVITAAEIEEYGGTKGLTPIPGSFTVLKSSPQGLMEILMAPVKGFLDAGDIGIFIIVVGALLGVLTKTRAIDVGIASLMQSMKARTGVLMTALIILFSIGGTTYGMCEETIAFYPILIPIMIAAGFDAMTAIAIIFFGAGVGVLASSVNPFATGIASGMMNISLGEGMLFRLLQYLIFTAITIVFVQRYAHLVQKNPLKSITADLNKEIDAHFLSQTKGEAEKLNGRQKAILAVFALTFIIMIYSVIPWSDMIEGFPLPELGWWFEELAALFLLSAIIIGVIGGMDEEEFISSFINGARDVLGVVLIIGLARGISILMTEGLIIDTILAGSEGAINGLPKVVYINVVYLFHVLLSIAIPSTSGLAAVSMPIMAPMADLAGVSRSMVITAYQSASGIVNLISPTAGILMGALMLAKIPYDRFLKFAWKYVLLIMILTMVMLSLGVAFNFG